MFTIDEMGTIHVSRGDSVGLSTQPFIETDDGIAAIPIEGDNCVIFTVKSRYSGRTIIKRILTEEDIVEALDEAIGKKANSDTPIIMPPLRVRAVRRSGLLPTRTARILRGISAV